MEAAPAHKQPPCAEFPRRWLTTVDVCSGKILQTALFSCSKGAICK
jgi:hypothetical protein